MKIRRIILIAFCVLLSACTSRNFTPAHENVPKFNSISINGTLEGIKAIFTDDYYEDNLRSVVLEEWETAALNSINYSGMFNLSGDSYFIDIEVEKIGLIQDEGSFSINLSGGMAILCPVTAKARYIIRNVKTNKTLISFDIETVGKAEFDDIAAVSNVEYTIKCANRAVKDNIITFINKVNNELY